ncbi:MAG: MFS transporter [Polyangiaceae bacterium]
MSAQLFVSMGAAPSTVGLTAAYGWAWNLKFLAAPVIERFGAPRQWVVVFELLLALAILGVSALAVGTSIAPIAASFLVVGVLAGAHDVAADAHYMAMLDPTTQTRLSGIRVAAFRGAMLAAGGGLVVLSGLLDFRFGLSVGAVVMLLLAAFHFKALFTRDPVARAAPARKAPRPSPVETLRTFVAKPRIGATLAFLALYRAGDALMLAMNPSFLKSFGFDTAMRGLLQGTLGAFLSAGGATLGGLYIARRGLSRTLFPIAVLQSVALLLYVWIAAVPLPTPVIVAVVCAEQLLAGIGTAGLTIFILRLARGPHRTTHYAVATSLMSIATTVLGLGSGFLLEATGFPLYFSIAFAASVPGVALAARVRDTYPDESA